MIRVWGRTNSSNVMKVLWLLDELGLPYERIDAGGKFGGTDTPEYRARQPFGLVPCIDDDGFTLFESNAILRYLCNAHAPGSAFYPTEAHARGRIDAWLDAQQTTLGPPQSTMFINLIRTPPDKRDAAAVAAAVVGAARVWSRLDARLAEHPFLLGAHPTLADIAIGVHAHRWFSMEIDRPDLPRLRAWYDRLRERPAYARHVAQPLS
jgi:glutathione S-transferase